MAAYGEIPMAAVKILFCHGRESGPGAGIARVC